MHSKPADRCDISLRGVSRHAKNLMSPAVREFWAFEHAMSLVDEVNFYVSGCHSHRMGDEIVYKINNRL